MKEKVQPQLSQKVSGKAHYHKTAKSNAVPVVSVQNHLGNAAVQRLLAQRSSDSGSFNLDDETARHINSRRGGGSALDASVQTQMSQSMGADFSGVRVHTDNDAHQLNEQLSAKAFTTGSDIFFRGGEYNPSSSSGQELIAHELTHVVQQSSGVVGSSGSGMTVNAPGDRFEQEADSVAKSVLSPANAAGVQREMLPEEEEIQAQRLQRADIEEEDELLQKQELPEEDEMLEE